MKEEEEGQEVQEVLEVQEVEEVEDSHHCLDTTDCHTSKPECYRPGELGQSCQMSP